MGSDDDHNNTSSILLPRIVRFITYQIIASMALGFEFRGSHGYPSPFKEVMNALSGIFTIDIVGVLHIDCLGRTNFEQKLFASTLLPIGAFVLEAAYQLGRMAFAGGPFLDGKAFRSYIILLYFIIPTACMDIFSSFSCIEFDSDDDFNEHSDSDSYLRAE